MRYLLALLVFLFGLEDVDRAQLEREMAAIQPPQTSLRAPANPTPLPFVPFEPTIDGSGGMP